MTIKTSNLVDASVSIPEVKKKVRNRWLFWLLVLGFVGGTAYLIYRLVVVLKSQQAKSRVLTHPVERQSLPITISANGTVKPERSINVSPKNSGIVKTLLVKEGDTVKLGQVLAYMEVKSGLQGNERVLLSFPPGARPQSTPRGGVFPGPGGGGGGSRRGESL